MEEILEIEECPICSGKHTYKLKVKTISILRLFTIESSLPKTKEFTRIFVCPVKKEKFEASFSLSNDIEEIAIEGIKGDEKG